VIGTGGSPATMSPTASGAGKRMGSVMGAWPPARCAY
jgi:hypothetical protein